MASLWQRTDTARTSHLAKVPAAVLVLGYGVVAAAIVVGVMVGTNLRT